MTAALAIVPRPSAELQRAVPIDPEQQRQADERYAIIKPLLSFAADPLQFAGLVLGDGRPVTTLARLEEFIAQRHGVTPRTLRRWVKRFRVHNMAGLVDRERADKGKSRWASKSEQHAQLAELAVHVYISEVDSYQLAWEKVAARAERMGLTPPDYKTVRAWIDSVPGPVKTFAIQGRRAYQQKYSEHITREYDMGAGEILVSDHAIVDVILQDDLWNNDRRHIRPRFTGLMDMRSRKITAYAFSQEGSSRSIATCIRQHIQRFGVFGTLYCDNGKDYRKVGRGAGYQWRMDEIPPEALGVVARIGARVQHCIPFGPQAKPIERFNGTLHERFDKGWITYCGSTPEQRPDACIAALARHEKLLKVGRPEDSDLPLASEYIRAAALWLEGDYNRRVKDVRGMKGLSPDQAFENFRWANQPASPDPAVLVPLLAERKRCTVLRNAITIDGERFISADEKSHQEMHERTGASVIVAYDPADKSWMAVIDDDGRVVAYLEPERLARQADDPETTALIAGSMERRHRRARETREYTEALSRRVLSNGYVPHAEQLLQLGRAPIDITGLVVHRPAQKLRPEAIEPENNMLPGDMADRLAARLRRNRAD